jgi:hypothetical protein
MRRNARQARQVRPLAPRPRFPQRAARRLNPEPSTLNLQPSKLKPQPSNPQTLKPSNPQTLNPQPVNPSTDASPPDRRDAESAARRHGRGGPGDDGGCGPRRRRWAQGGGVGYR